MLINVKKKGSVFFKTKKKIQEENEKRFSAIKTATITTTTAAAANVDALLSCLCALVCAIRSENLKKKSKHNKLVLKTEKNEKIQSCV